MMTRMQTELGLSNDQVQQIKSIYQTAFGSMGQPGGQVSREERRAAFDKARAEVEKILTPEQKTKWEAMRQERERRRGGGGGNGQRGQGGGNNN
jgi:Spy/CpxP family protein refolding chaperone